MSDHPQVFFPIGDGHPFHLGQGFLAIIDGIPWLAPTIEDAKAGVLATMHRLNPQLLEPQIDATGKLSCFHYGGALYERAD
jgi:hypothetical protein